MSYKKFKVLGYTTDFNKCDCCGKENLKGTVSILDLDYEVVGHYGVVCAAAIDKYDTLDAAKMAKKEINKVVNTYKTLVQFAGGVAAKIMYVQYGKDHSKTAPAGVWDAQLSECVAFYTNPENKFKAYQHPALDKYRELKAARFK
jgi:hypothetical protein